MNNHLGKLVLGLSIIPIFVINLQTGAYEWLPSLKMFLTIWAIATAIICLFAAVKSTKNILEEGFAITAIVLSIGVIAYLHLITVLTSEYR